MTMPLSALDSPIDSMRRSPWSTRTSRRPRWQARHPLRRAAVSYGDLRGGQSRRQRAEELGVRMEERVAILLPDGRVGLRVLRRHEDRGGGRTAQHDVETQGLRVPAQRQPGAGAGGACLALARGRWRSAAICGISSTWWSSGGEATRRAVSRISRCSASPVPRTGGDQQGRRGVLALQFGHDRFSQGGRAPAPRHARGRRSLRPADDRTAGIRRVASRWPSSSSPMGWATGCISRSAPAATTVLLPDRPTPEKHL